VAGPKKQLLEYLRDQYVRQEVQPSVEVNSFFQSPSDSFLLPVSLVVGAGAMNGPVITVPEGETWLLNHLSARIAFAAATAIGAVGYVNLNVRLNRAPSQYVALSHQEFSAAAIPAAGSHNIFSAFRPSHEIYLEGGSILGGFVFNTSAANVTFYLDALVTPIGKDIR